LSRSTWPWRREANAGVRNHREAGEVGGSRIEAITYQPGGALDVIVKDMRSLLDYAAEGRVPLPVAALAFQRLHDVWR
jgi:3-hydroxyisobutyrate dehydrogenase-like beta-hydroxyacid dehydrogenase